MNNIFFCIDLKSFYASVECVIRKLDPFTTCLVVADSRRGQGAICLAISPAMKALGIPNRCRIYEIPKNINYITAMPRMKLYIDYSSKIYGIYLKYFAKEDIHVYSIDEAFLDVTSYLTLYQIPPQELAKKIMKSILDETGITATAGIGTNLYLAKIALDLKAKKAPDHIGFLDVKTYQEELWMHQPLDDFWQIGSGISKRLKKIGIQNMFDIVHTDKEKLYKEFGINATFLINHAYGLEPCTMNEIKNYKKKSCSLSSSQILFKDYPYEKARLIVKEMVDLGSLELIEKDVVTNSIGLCIGYSKDTRKPSSSSMRIPQTTNVYSVLVEYFMTLFDAITDKNTPIRRIGISFHQIHPKTYEQLDLFTNSNEVEKEVKMERVVNQIKKKFGKNTILRGMSLEEDATTIKRNKLIGGHNSDEEE